jgi:hypothetical protein
MKKRAIALLSCLCTFLFFSAEAQSPYRTVGDINPQDFQLKTSGFAASAPAVVLYSYGKSSYTEDIQLKYEYQSRVLVREEEGFDKGRFVISLGINDSLQDFSLNTYSLQNGQVKKQEFDTTNLVYDLSPEGYYDYYVEAPDLKEGVIVEISYTILYEDWSILNTWFFQQDVPVLRSDYYTEIPNFLDFKATYEGVFNYGAKVIGQKQAEFRDKKAKVLQTYYQMDTIPAFAVEPGMLSETYYVSKMVFELAEYELPKEEPRALLAENYEFLAEFWAWSDYYREVYQGNAAIDRLLREKISRDYNDLQKAQAIYYLIRNSVTVSPTKKGTLEEVFKQQSGTAEQINLLLTQVLRRAGLNANVLLISTFDTQPLYPNYPVESVFNYTLTALNLKGTYYFLDATDRHLLFNTLKPNTRVNKGLHLWRTNPGWLEIKNNAARTEKLVAKWELSQDGRIYGTVNHRMEAYGLYLFEKEFGENEVKRKDFLSSRSGRMRIDQYDKEYTYYPEKILTENYSISKQLDANRLNPFDFIPLDLPTFKLDSRQYPFSIEYPMDLVYSFIIKLPKNLKFTSELPNELRITLPDRSGMALYNCKKRGNTLEVSLRIQTGRAVFNGTEYQVVKEFFNQINEKAELDLLYVLE